ncbi:hypothetical protein BDZ91DRAFT_796219 [Kalaharituber pfeilii]|nr:hypothetical protein BDZ91DRAFT_796219 [Kalaharituber pfeilii]
MAENYNTPPFDFQPEPEPEPPASLRSPGSPTHPDLNGAERSSNGNADNSDSKAGDGSKSSSEEDTDLGWSSLTFPGAVLNGTIYLIGKTIEFLAPYWPNSYQRQKIWSWAQAHPVLTSFLLTQMLFVVAPIAGFAAFVVATAVVVIGSAVIGVVMVGVGVGLVVFVPALIWAGFLGSLVWVLMYVGVWVARVAWEIYRQSEYHKTGLVSESVEETKQGMKQEPKDKDDVPFEPLRVLPPMPEMDRSESVSSTASSGVHVEKHGHRGDVEDGNIYGSGEGHSVFRMGERDEDKVGRDIARSLG